MSKLYFSAPNSSDRPIFVKIWVKDMRKNTGVIRPKRQAKMKICVILTPFGDLVHVQSVVDLFAKQLNNALNVH